MRANDYIIDVGDIELVSSPVQFDVTKNESTAAPGFAEHTDAILEELGFEPEFNVANPAKWMAAANDTFELVNFFEATNTSYEVNAQA